MGKHRDANVTIILGKNGTGKSTLMRKILDATKGRALVVTYNGAPKIWHDLPFVDIRDRAAMDNFKGMAQNHFIQNEKATWQYLHDNFRNGALVFDDCRGYLQSNINVGDPQLEFFKRILLNFRHHMIDVYFVVHSPKDVPPNLWQFTSNVWVGATDALYSKSQANTASAEIIINTQKDVNSLFMRAKAKNNGSHYGIFKLVRVG